MAKQKVAKFWTEFKKFITKGNVVDLAVAVVVGTAFNKIVTSLVNDIIMPLVSLALGKPNVKELKVVFKMATDETEEVALRYGEFFQYIIDFLIIALTIFIIIRVFVKLKNTLDFRANMIKNVQEKLDKDEQLNDFEEKWLKRFTKKHPELAPKKVEKVETIEEVKLTKTEELLTQILENLQTKKTKKNESDKTNK